MQHDDHRPPRIFGDERANLTSMLDYHRASVVRKAADLTDDGARFSPVDSATSILWIVKHLARAETLWIIDRFAGDSFDPAWVDDAVAPGDSLAGAIDRYLRVQGRVDEIVARSDLATICVGEDDQSNPDLRWVLIHLSLETARHAGHADILREMIDGRTGR